MTRDREAALRGLFGALSRLLDAPQPVHHGDMLAYYEAIDMRRGFVLSLLRGLQAGAALDNTAVQSAGRQALVLAGELPVAYEPVPPAEYAAGLAEVTHG